MSGRRSSAQRRRSATLPSLRRSWRLGDDIIKVDPIDLDVIWDYWSETTLNSVGEGRTPQQPDGSAPSQEKLLPDGDSVNEKKESAAEDWHLFETGKLFLVQERIVPLI